LPKKLKKNNVAVDVVSYGDSIEETVEDGRTVLKAFVENANNGDNSHILSVPPGAHLLSDALIASPILSADRSSSIPDELTNNGDGPVPTGSGNNFEFGVDPSLDPELAMALRISMQEAQAREAAEAASSSTIPSATAPTQPGIAQSSSMTSATGATDEEEHLLQRALSMSVEQDVEMEGADMDEDEDEDAAIARAIEMSMRGEAEEERKRSKYWAGRAR